MSFKLLVFQVFFLIILKHASGTDLQFVPNQGQWNSAVHFACFTGNGIIVFTSDQVIFGMCDAEELHERSHSTNDDSFESVTSGGYAMRFINANQVIPTGTDTLVTKYHFYIGSDSLNWRSNVLSNSSIYYENFYNGIDLRFYTYEGSLKYEFIVHPGANPNLIKWQYDHANSAITNDGSISIDFGSFNSTEQSPYCYQKSNNETILIESSFDNKQDVFSYKLGNWDKKRELIIDPTIVWSSFSAIMIHECAAINPDGSTVFASQVSWGFVDLNPHDYTGLQLSVDETTDHLGVCQLSASGENLEWVAIIGGSEGIHAIEMDTNIDGKILVYSTISVSGEYPVTDGAFASSVEGNSGKAICCLSADATELIGFTLFGWPESFFDSMRVFNFSESEFNTQGRICSVQADDQYVYIATTCRVYWNYGDFQLSGEVSEENRKVLIYALPHDMTEIVWARFIDLGEQAESYSIDLRDMILTEDSNLIFCGRVTSANLPVTPNAYQSQLSGSSDAYIGKINTINGDLLNLTYVGGSGYEEGFVLDEKNGKVLLMGKTDTPDSVPNIQNMHGTGLIWLCQLDSDLQEVDFSYCIGSNDGNFMNDVFPYGLGSNSCGNIILSAHGTANCGGDCSEGLSGWPITPDAWQSDIGFNYIAEINTDAGNINFATYYGGGQAHYSRSRVQNEKLYLGICVEDYFSPSSDLMGTPGAYSTVIQELSQSNMTVIDFSTPHSGLVQSAFSNDNAELSCFGSLLQFDPATNGNQLIWNFGDGTILNSDSVAVVHEYLEPGIYEVALTVVDSSTCNITDTSILEIEIPEVPEFLADWELSEINPCEFPQTLNLNYSGSGYNQLLWSLPDGSEITDVSQLDFELDAPGIYAFSLQLNHSECDTSAVLNYSVEIFQPLQIEVDYTLEQSAPCEPYLLNAWLEGIGYDSIFWEDSESNSSNQSSFSQLYEEGEYLLTLTVINDQCEQEEYFEILVDVPDTSPELIADWEVSEIDPCLLPQFVSLVYTGTEVSDYTWTFPDGSTITAESEVQYEITESGQLTFELLVYDAACDTSATLSTSVEIYPPLQVQMLYSLSELPLCSGYLLEAQAIGSGFESLVWTDSEGNSSESVYFNAEYTFGLVEINVEAIDEDCATSLLLTEQLNLPEQSESLQIIVPNIFSPQQDGVNDQFFLLYPQAEYGIEDFDFSLYNRWGTQVYQSSNPDFRWDGLIQGEQLEAGTYFYTIRFKHVCDEEEVSQNGSLMIVR